MDIVSLDGFVSVQDCATIVSGRPAGQLSPRSDNGVQISALSKEAQGLVGRIMSRASDIVSLRYGKGAVTLDHVLLTALVPPFMHVLHADAVKLVCLRHRENFVDCDCDDAQIVPNHTPDRKFTAILYLDNDHLGGNTIFGRGPIRYRDGDPVEIASKAGSMVIAPTDERHFHETTPVHSGIRHALVAWFR